MRIRTLEHDDETRARADPARSHPIERSRRTELNAERVLLLVAAERGRTVTSPIGALEPLGFSDRNPICFRYFRYAILPGDRVDTVRFSGVGCLPR